MADRVPVVPVAIRVAQTAAVLLIVAVYVLGDVVSDLGLGQV